ncbi:SGNH/GDSL hydrolase family protein [Variovorax sp. J22P168]|uniref:SGNH/GDSL hydrolase family protein n=1 Tax=Variovorax jilinensis TaxID=3053513 RepID=UPI0025770A84|nr:SGNH/GDSL hydrolase family protein [Variovorax sp. J22P168]MDM0012570.1 SGNH/GDSL hydrolase family protein [Variovorax sp. J22P168]
MPSGVRTATATIALAGLVAVFGAAAWDADHRSAQATAPLAIPLAVLGDSDSHSYQDHISFPAGSKERGGALRSRTYQWTEVLARLRSQELDLGPWGSWGEAPGVIQSREWLLMAAPRSPRREDYRYNFAYSGARCLDLMSGQQQARRLVELMNREPVRWQQGVVVIRMGFNDWRPLFDAQARDPAAPEVLAATDECRKDLGAAVALIQASHPATRVALVGIGNGANGPTHLHKWQSAAETQKLQLALTGFNDAIRDLGKGNPKVTFFDELAFFEGRWGGRSADGKPAPGTVSIGPRIQVRNTIGDDPRNAWLADTHAGVARSAIWAQALVARLDEAFGMKLTPITDAELRRFLEPLFEPTAAAATPPTAPGS